MCWLSMLLVLYSTPKVFLWVLQFFLSLKTNISKSQFDWMWDLPQNHFRVSGASWLNIKRYLFKVKHNDQTVMSFCLNYSDFYDSSFQTSSNFSLQAYLEAGSDIIETNTFSGTSIAQADYGTEYLVSLLQGLNRSTQTVLHEEIIVPSMI